MTSSGIAAAREQEPLWQLLFRGVAIAYLAAIGGLLFWTMAPLAVGWTPRVTLTGSMIPTLMPGDIAITTPAPKDPPKLGRIVLVSDDTQPSGFYLHRVVDIDDEGKFITRGDGNPSPDSVAVGMDRIAGALGLMVPNVGHPVLWLKERQFLPLGIAVGLTWAAFTVLLMTSHRTGATSAPSSTDRGYRGRVGRRQKATW
jgi:signal peptidase